MYDDTLQIKSVYTLNQYVYVKQGSIILQHKKKRDFEIRLSKVNSTLNSLTQLIYERLGENGF